MSERRDGFDERSGGDPNTPWWGVHVARYEFGCRHLAHRRRLLDVACGTGYGLALLETEAESAVGVELDHQVATQARQSGRCVVVADATHLPFPDGSFDGITSFETIEHLEDRKGFVRELQRVLDEGGQLVLSTPNAVYTEPVKGKPRNPYHLHEYHPEELRAELSNSFIDLALVGQTLRSHIAVSPFDDDQRRLPRTLRTRARLLVWRLLNKLPALVRDTASSAIWGHPLFPGPDDYAFDESTVREAPVMVAVGRRR